MACRLYIKFRSVVVKLLSDSTLSSQVCIEGMKQHFSFTFFKLQLFWLIY